MQLILKLLFLSTLLASLVVAYALLSHVLDGLGLSQGYVIFAFVFYLLMLSVAFSMFLVGSRRNE